MQATDNQGDIIVLKLGAIIPADCVLLAVKPEFFSLTCRVQD